MTMGKVVLPDPYEWLGFVVQPLRMVFFSFTGGAAGSSIPTAPSLQHTAISNKEPILKRATCIIDLRN